MAKRSRVSRQDSEFGEPVETEEAEQQETFADQKGSAANEHAKALAKAKAKKRVIPSGVFYTLKGAKKVVKVIVKHSGVHEVYVGNKERHKDGLAPLMKQWQAAGAWVEPHAVKEKIAEIRAKLPKASK